MKLSELKKGECGKIVSIASDSVLKARFNSFGITRGAQAFIVEQTLSKNTIEIRVDRTKIALRVKEADLIEVEKSVCEV